MKILLIHRFHVLCLLQVNFGDEDNSGQMRVDLVTTSAIKPCSDISISVPGKHIFIPSLFIETNASNSLTIIKLFL